MFFYIPTVYSLHHKILFRMSFFFILKNHKKKSSLTHVHSDPQRVCYIAVKIKFISN